MKLISYQSEIGPCVAGVRDGAYVHLHQANPNLPRSMEQLLAAGAPAMAAAATAVRDGPLFGPQGVRLLAPVPHPNKVICVGLNYADHARETGKEPPAEPVIFCKFATAVAAHDDPIVLPSLSNEVDYEAELVVVIGTGGRHIREEDALEHVAGYCCGQDVSARDWQIRKPGGQWLLGKSFDGFAPFGPALVTSDEVGDPGKLDIRLRLNGQTMQDSNTSQFIFSVGYLVSYISGVCTLAPGDVIFTGTPPGVGVARKPKIFLKPGDVVEVEIDKVGMLRNRVIAEAR